MAKVIRKLNQTVLAREDRMPQTIWTLHGLSLGISIRTSEEALDGVWFPLRERESLTLVLLLARGGVDIQSCHHFPRRHRPGALTVMLHPAG